MINKGAESLPGKDAQTYKQLAKYYDAKNYKKGLKNAEKLLETHPDHPETIALKALFQLALGEEAKALESGKLSLLKSKMKSLFCWHTCGTIYKQRKDFLEAAKCFQNALRLEPDNLQIMRQTAALQVQVRDHANHTATRFAILKQKPNMIQNWVGYTLAHHLRGDFPSLFKALSSLDNLIKTTELKPTELAHYYLYRVIAFRDAERWEQMLQELKKNKSQIKDEVMYHQLMHQCCQRLDKSAEAEQALEFLLNKFPQNLEYLRQYQALNRMPARQAYIKAQTTFRSKIAKILELTVIEDADEFTKTFTEFIKPYFVKNLISLFTEIQAVYEAGKETLIEGVLLAYETALAKEAYPDGTQIQSPSEYLWSLYLLAQHFSRRFETLPRAHQYIRKAIAHTCTVPEFYLVKADIQYKAHNNLAALKTINEARKTDLADRFMNNICVKYLMRCEQPEVGEQVLRLFMRDEASLYQLQNHWYIIEAGKSFLKQRNFAAGLRHLDFIAKHFLDFQGNEFDFHTYCLRKWTLREYTQLIDFNDNIYDDKKYAEAAGWALKYLQEYVHFLKEEELRVKAEQEAKGKEEEKQAKKKKKKKKAVENVPEETPLQAFRKRIDYFGKDYSQRVKKNPLEQALAFAKNVSTIRYTNKGNAYENKLFGRAFSEAIDVFIHFKKPLLVLRLLNKLTRTRFCPFALHFSTIKALIYFQNCLQDPKTNDISREMITQFVEATLKGRLIGEYNEIEVNSWSQSVESNRQFLLDIKRQESTIILKGNERGEFIELYLKQLTSLSSSEISYEQIPLLFYLTHQLEFYGRLTEQMKTTLNTKVGTHTTYFSDWRVQIPKLPESTWSQWWLSDYDIEREEIEEKEEAKQKEAEEAKQKQAEKTQTP